MVTLSQPSEPIRLQRLEFTSPSLAETMRSCMLRAGLSRASGAPRFVLGNPKAWLGAAYHEVLAQVAGIASDDGTPDIDDLWHDAIQRQHERAKHHPLDGRYGEPTSWPGYHVALASLRLRADDLLQQWPEHQRIRTSSAENRTPIRQIERALVALHGNLVGRPDLVGHDEVLDYKTGDVFESDADDAPDVIRESYVRQLRIYGYLIWEGMGRWIRRGVLLPMSGGRVEVDLDPSACEREAKAAVGLMQAYNSLIEQKDPDALASPSPSSCRWCPYKIMCPSFWKAAKPGWETQIGGAIEGVLVGPARQVHGGAAYAISIDTEAGTRTGRIDLAPLPASSHRCFAAAGEGRVRLVGLRVRKDGSYVPTIRTVSSMVKDVPSLETAAE